MQYFYKNYNYSEEFDGSKDTQILNEHEDMIIKQYINKTNHEITCLSDSVDYITTIECHNNPDSMVIDENNSNNSNNSQENNDFDNISIEKKWQKIWKNNKVFEVDNNPKNPFYTLVMLPYPSGSLHMGHIRNYTIGDVFARYKRCLGYNVLSPMGWDAFGLPAENAANKHNIHPQDWTERNISEMKDQLQSVGFSYDWSREIATCRKDYYKHMQKIFLIFYQHNIAYKKKSLINWDPVEQTVLANEQVIDGKGWRSGAVIEKKMLDQWFLRISDFSNELLSDIEKLTEWPEQVKVMQKNWIGKSEGAEIDFEIDYTEILQSEEYNQSFQSHHANQIEVQNDIKLNSSCIQQNENITCKDEKYLTNTSFIPTHIKIFTTMPEHIFGCTFCAISYNHPFIETLISMLKKSKHKDDIEKFINECSQGSVSEKDLTQKEKSGIFTKIYLKHPINNEKIPLFIANYVLIDHGSGAIYGCPAHDERDYEFAIKYGLNIKSILTNMNDLKKESLSSMQDSFKINNVNNRSEYLDNLKKEFVKQTDQSVFINSQFLNGLSPATAKEKILNFIEKNNMGKRKTTFRLRDWCISRQRYWGCPIPIIYCDNCGMVEAQDLPITLPYDVTFDIPGNPLDRHASWKYTTCPKCNGNATRDTDTLDTFFDSSWYFLRYCSPNSEDIFDKNAVQNWMPVNQYIGGIEHAVLHLLYARFFVKALKHCNLLDFDEPFMNLFTQGMICHATYKTNKGEWINPAQVRKIIENGSEKYVHLNTNEEIIVGLPEKMSKSKSNLISALDILQSHGADALRFFILSDSPPEKDLHWNDTALDSCKKYLKSIFIAFKKFHNIILSYYSNDLTIFIENNCIAQINEMHYQSTTQENLTNIERSNNFEKNDTKQVNHFMHNIKDAENTNNNLSNHMNTFIKKCSDYINTYQLNNYIAQIRIFSSILFKIEISQKNVQPLLEAWKTFIITISPVIPHIAEEMWAMLTLPDMVCQQKWPKYNKNNNEIVKIVIQINNKIKMVIQCSTEESNDEKFLKEQAIRSCDLSEDKIQKIIIVKGKTVNLIM